MEVDKVLFLSLGRFAGDRGGGSDRDKSEEGEELDLHLDFVEVGGVRREN